MTPFLALLAAPEHVPGPAARLNAVLQPAGSESRSVRALLDHDDIAAERARHPAFKALEVINRLVSELRDPASPHHGGWDRRPVRDGSGAMREIVTFPRVWLARLDTAAARGAFARYAAR
ncbi:MAG: hypothetical protein ACOY6K_12595, partial [Pseudomonadota bacterium]